MIEPTQEEIHSTVSSLFDISYTEISLTKMKFRFRNDDFKEKFVELTQLLETRNLVCVLERKNDEIFLVVSKFPPLKQRKWLSKTWTPRILFAVTVAMVLIDGFFRTAGLNTFMPIGDPLGVAILYAWALIGILGVHEAGHLFAAKWHKIKTTWPYFIPGVPVFGIPTFGAFIQSRGLTVNRDILFDIAIAGPIAGLVVAIIVAAFGAYTSPVIDSQIAEQMFGTSQLIQMNENLIMMGMLELFDKNRDDVEVIMSPIMFAAWLGFLITFLNLLPAWQLDGGHMSRVLLGQKWHKIATYASMGVLVLLNYWMMAVLILILSSRSKDAQPLDDISPLSKNRKIIYIGVIVLAILCAPLPNSFFI
ncbi:MAG: site-2 protease family protein [Thermoproteota archaeon]|jgi:Zn-dependent protease|nr:site-2 protease family protein [Thermoproteota archaeon]|tara:strand:- start:667 stop:1755 length:1089 start_codon:yes stop_codon:yes gene_type:complete